MKRTVMTAFAAAALSTLAACSSNPGPDYAAPEGTAETTAEAQRAPIHLNVENDNFLAVTVRAISGGANTRLGTVESGTQEVFELPNTASPFDLRFAVDPVGSRKAFMTPELTVERGAVVNMEVKQNLDLTTVTVRNR